MNRRPCVRGRKRQRQWGERASIVGFLLKKSHRTPKNNTFPRADHYLSGGRVHSENFWFAYPGRMVAERLYYARVQYPEYSVLSHDQVDGVHQPVDAARRSGVLFFEARERHDVRVTCAFVGKPCVAQRERYSRSAKSYNVIEPLVVTVSEETRSGTNLPRRNCPSVFDRPRVHCRYFGLSITVDGYGGCPHENIRVISVDY